jgi:hypothetical protein
MLKNALSPEIGGNFIESMNAPDYYEERLKNKYGMPIIDWEIDKKKYREFDPEPYSILRRIMESGQENENTQKKIGKYFQEKQKRVREDIYIEEDADYKQKKEIFSSENAFMRREFLEVFKEKDNGNGQKEEGGTGTQLVKYFNELCSEVNNRVFYPKVRHSRTAFYQLEQALHYQLKQLFISNSNYRDTRIYDGLDIYNKTKAACEKDEYDFDVKSEEPIMNEAKEWEDCLDKIKREFRMHVIFELLTYFYHDYLTGIDAKEEN